jgi:hypothetical protein
MPKILRYSPIGGNINSLQFKEQSGLVIQSLKLTFYGKKNAYQKKLYLKTPQTIIKTNFFWLYY